MSTDDGDGGNFTVNNFIADDFGWKASMTSFRKTGRKDFAVYGDGVIRCTVSNTTTGNAGVYSAGRATPACD